MGGVFICRVRPPARCWPCKKLGRVRASTALCDGPAPPASRKATCDVPLCGEHRVHVGTNRDLCPACAAAAARVSSVAEVAGDPDDELATMRPDGAPLTLFDVATAAEIRRIG